MAQAIKMVDTANCCLKKELNMRKTLTDISLNAKLLDSSTH